ncbi:lysophospholipase [Massilia sp. DWR3-1-1]|uniref:alpha/beta hydrolase n=1 Tax=Massilia sp. DWR3-1-1 TaxID=2804559 RepID=UPI003CEC9351
MPHLVALGSHQISAADGTLLHVTDSLLPPGQARGSVVVMHGLGEHSGRYRHVADFFNSCGLSVRCYDHRGHGRSEGRRGDVIHGEPLLQDAQIIIDDFADRYSAPPFLFGHSMGGLFAARFALSQRAPLRGLILSSPALALRLTPVERALLRVAETLVPWLGVPNGINPASLCHSAAVVAAYKADPLVHARISARLLRSMLRAIDDCQRDAASMSVPTLLLVAGSDRAVDPAGALRFYEKLPPHLAQLRVYEPMFHEIFNEPDAALAFDDLRAWLHGAGQIALP